MSNSVSVVMPTYNSAEFIVNTLECIRNQTVAPQEVIIVDDGSKDNTVSVIHQYSDDHQNMNIKLFEQKNQGPGAARNKGIDEASGEWIAFLDSDDYWSPDKIEKVKHMIDDSTDAVIVTHDEYEEDVEKNVILKELHKYYNPELPLFYQLFRGCFLSTSCMTVKRETLLAVGKFDITLRSAQDYDLWLRVSECGKIVFIPEPLEKYVLRNESVSSNIMLRFKCLTRIGYKYANRLTHYVDKKSARKVIFKKVSITHVQCMQGAMKKKQYGNALKILLLYPFMLMRTLKYSRL